MPMISGWRFSGHEHAPHSAAINALTKLVGAVATSGVNERQS